VGAVFPHLAPIADRTFEAVDALDPSSVGAAFVALPAGGSAGVVPGLVEAGVRVVDLGADFRLAAEAYPAWYGFEHSAPEWLGKAVYGLTERARDAVGGAAVVANPGCYPTPVGLGLAPLFEAGLLDPQGPVMVDGKSGISGAGKEPTAASHFASLDGTVRAYKVGRHQHTPEMEMVLRAGGAASTVTFIPHLVPTVRGVVTTCYARLAAGATAADLRATLSGVYSGEPFVRVLAEGETPDPKRLTGTNVCELSAHADEHAGTAIVIGAVDNLGKGAAGQAIQNLNLMLGLPETAGLTSVGVYP
jgi:N-acetyl-gamma-glutamyl-phosphate reductase